MEDIEAIDFQYLSDRARAYIMGLEAKLSSAVSDAARTLGTLHYEANKVYRDATEGRYYE